VGAKAQGIVIGGNLVAPGERRTLELPMASLYSHAPMSLPVQVVCGKRTGPTLFVSAAVHGDEINGVEIIRRLQRLPQLSSLRGVLLSVPIVNVYGFVNNARYLPDRRDLNRSFPGSLDGSMAARLAHLFMTEIVSRSDYGIDLHTGAVHRDNLPQVRANLADARVAAMASVFDVPIVLNSGSFVEGSLRQAAARLDIPVLVYEAGEALRFDEHCIRAGVKGVVSVLRHLGMLPRARQAAPGTSPVIARSSAWVRAGRSGIHRATVALGARVQEEDIIGIIADPFGEQELQVRAGCDGVIIGRSNLPLVNEGEALFHIARFESPDDAENAVETFQSDALEIHPGLDREPPIL